MGSTQAKNKSAKATNAKAVPEKITLDNVKSVADDKRDAVASIKEGVTRPYQCTICDKRFKTKSGLAGHMTTHKIETPSTEPQEEEMIEDPFEWVTQYAKDGKVTNKEIVKQLAEDEATPFMIPRDMLESGASKQLVGINGQFFEYPKAEYITVPRKVATLLQKNYQSKRDVDERFSMERNEKVVEALTR